MESELSLTIPVYNEEEGIAITVNHLEEEFEKNKLDYEIVLVNHGSRDNTKNVLERLAKKNHRLKVINLPKNLGYGGGIMYGFEHSEGRNMGFTCADEEVSAKEVYKVYDELRKKGCDISKARRIDRKDGLFRKFTSFVFNSLINIRFRLGLKDVNGYPIFMKRELFQSVKTKEIAYLFNLDFLRNIKRRNYKIIEVPVVHHKREKGKSYMRISRIAEMALGFLKYSFHAKKIYKF